jgi:hypothetical protein
MHWKDALKSQHQAGLTMLKDCIEKCPADLWVAGEHPRTFWRIAYHALFYTDLYLYPNLDAFQPWEKHRQGVPTLWGTPEEVEPYTIEETLGYLDAVSTVVEARVDALDVSAGDGLSLVPEHDQAGASPAEPASSPRTYRAALRTTDAARHRHKLNREIILGFSLASPG